MKIKVSSAAGFAQDTELDVAPAQRVQDLIRDVADAQGVSPENIGLMHNGKQLDPSKTVKQSSIQEGDVVKAIPKDPVGGIDVSVVTQNRIRNEIQRVRASSIPLIPETPFRWKGKITGEGQWRGQEFPIEVTLPPDYPAKPPRVRFLEQPTPRHPNIHPTGGVCHNHIMTAWQPTMNLVTVYDDLRWLFLNPNYRSSYYPASELRASATAQPATEIRPNGTSWLRRILG